MPYKAQTDVSIIGGKRPRKNDGFLVRAVNEQNKLRMVKYVLSFSNKVAGGFAVYFYPVMTIEELFMINFLHTF